MAHELFMINVYEVLMVINAVSMYHIHNEMDSLSSKISFNFCMLATSSNFKHCRNTLGDADPPLCGGNGFAVSVSNVEVVNSGNGVMVEGIVSNMSLVN